MILSRFRDAREVWHNSEHAPVPRMLGYGAEPTEEIRALLLATAKKLHRLSTYLWRMRRWGQSYDVRSQAKSLREHAGVHERAGRPAALGVLTPVELEQGMRRLAARCGESMGEAESMCHAAGCVELGMLLAIGRRLMEEVSQ